ncbi:hypothetical protein PIROE2DRAFT_20920 [Piromyces sp. E2]|nr:hypothetical protein PIROE2DRAFT_20920 [Piromyces sp. E2]|eukprot:OUM61624.1 hypothetical protein PIROE2DRAFT_20920 [Piromyces sp. E2]
MEVPIWTSINEVRLEAIESPKDLKQHMAQYNERLNKKESVTPEEISILWTAYKLSEPTLKKAAVLNNLLKFCKTDQGLGLILLKSQYNSETCNLKDEYDESVVKGALSLIKDMNSVESCLVEALKNDGWLC